MLTLTREGIYEINWGPGTVHIPLQRAPSGHLVFRTDAFVTIQPQPNVGLRETAIGLYSNLQVGPSDRNPAGLEHPIHPTFRREVHAELGTDGSPRRNYNLPGDRRAAGSSQYIVMLRGLLKIWLWKTWNRFDQQREELQRWSFHQQQCLDQRLQHHPRHIRSSQILKLRDHCKRSDRQNGLVVAIRTACAR